MKKGNQLQPTLTKEYGLIDTGFEISVYRHGELLANSKDYANDIIDLLVVDLKMSGNVVDRMIQRMVKNGWTQKRFKDAVDYVEENCTFYPPKPAEFESYDKKVRFNTYQEICDKSSQYTAIYSKGTNEPVYVTKKENELYKFPLWDEKYRVDSKLTNDQQIDLCIKQDRHMKERINKSL